MTRRGFVGRNLRGCRGILVVVAVSILVYLALMLIVFAIADLADML